MDSDHCPIVFKLKMKGSPPEKNKTILERYNFNKADWTKFSDILTKKALFTKYFLENSLLFKNSDIEKMNELVTNDIYMAAEMSIPKIKVKCTRPLPEYILNFIRLRKKARKDLKKNDTFENRTEYNKLTGKIRKSIWEFTDNKWKNFLDKHGSHPVSTRPFWEEINKSRNKKSVGSIPTLKKNNIKYDRDQEKANLFANILSNTFSSDFQKNDFDNDHYNTVIEEVSKKDFNKETNEKFSMYELVSTIKKLKIGSSPGTDGLHNIFFQKLPFTYLNIILKLINNTLIYGLPSNWKTAAITMIPKKKGNSPNPNDYRPISLTSCLGKLAERLVKTRLYEFLEKNNKIIIEQSGFRNHRSASDNLLFFTQKISETLNKDKKACGIFFDISKAFDRVWHDGLIYKLINMNLPFYLIKYIKNFLNNRKFFINVKGQLSDTCPIECAVPQGCALSPILFSIYINDIPLAQSKHIAYSVLFADDLGTLFQFHNKTILEKMVNVYLGKLTKWLYKWRLNMNTLKCNYKVISKSGKAESGLKLNLNNRCIPYCNNPIFLGVTFDTRLCFNAHYDYLRERALKRLNIIKIFSNKSYLLTKKTLKCMYRSLVGSIFDYSFFTIANVSKSNLGKLQIIQNSALKCIYKFKRNYPTRLLHETSQILTVTDRLKQLGCRFMVKSMICNPLIRILTVEYLKSISSIQRLNKNSTPLCVFLPIICIAIFVQSLTLAIISGRG